MDDSKGGNVGEVDGSIGGWGRWVEVDDSKGGNVGEGGWIV